MVIESLLSNMSLHSLRNAGAKVQKFCQSVAKRRKKFKFLSNYWSKRYRIEDFLLLLHVELFFLEESQQFIGRTSNYDTRLARYNDGWQLIPRIGAWGAGDCDSIVRRAS